MRIEEHKFRIILVVVKVATRGKIFGVACSALGFAFFSISETPKPSGEQICML